MTDALQTRIEELEAENAWLKGEGGAAVMRVREEWGVTPLESRFLLTLARRERMSHAHIYDALYGDRPDADQPGFEISKVLVCHLRAKLRGRLVILTVWGQGYRLDAASRAAVLETAGETGRATSEGGKGDRPTAAPIDPPADQSMARGTFTKNTNGG